MLDLSLLIAIVAVALLAAVILRLASAALRGCSFLSLGCAGLLLVMLLAATCTHLAR